jgi:ABC-type polysaccharide/polyol phosphate transport system ATPase subunit
MNKITVDVDNITIQFPKTKPFFGTIENSISSFLKLEATETDDFIALDGVSLQLFEGEIVGIIGKNGSGKSTLLRTISGIYNPDKGMVRTKGQISLLARLGIGFNVHLTGRENIYLYGSILGHTKKTMDGLIDEIINFSELALSIDKPLRTYSSGMKTRLSFSVASAVKSEILLIDEVLGVGDYDFREKSNIRMQEMVNDAATVVIVSHSLPVLEQMCSRLILIEDGKIKAIGKPSEIIDIYKTTSKLKNEESNLAKLITKEKPKKTLGKKIIHNLNLFSLLLLRIFGLSEWAASSIPVKKIKKDDKERIISEHWGTKLENIRNTNYFIDEETKKILKLEKKKDTKKLTLVMLTCVWKRPKLTKIIMAYYSKLKEEVKEFLNLEFVAVGSEGEESKNISENGGFHYFEHENQPMSKKWQYGLEMTKQYDPDAVIIMGSDDIITRKILEFYVEKITQKYVLIGMKDFYIYEISLKKLAHWRGYGELNDAHRMDETIGLGRCLARSLLDKIEFDIWGGLELTRNLDGAMTNRLKEFGIFPVSDKECPIINCNGEVLRIGHVGYKLNEMNGFAMDIKSKTNVTDFNRYLDRDPESVTFMEGGILKEHIYENTIREIMALDGQE